MFIIVRFDWFGSSRSGRVGGSPAGHTQIEFVLKRYEVSFVSAVVCVAVFLPSS